MPKFGTRSKKILETCDPKIQEVMNEVVKIFDISIISGHRGEDEQNELYRMRRSKVKYPNSKHNASPSRAVDIVPYVPGRRIDWEDTEHFHYMAGYVMAIAKQKGIELRWGGDWDKDGDLKDEVFRDLGHFELD